MPAEEAELIAGCDAKSPIHGHCVEMIERLHV